MNKIQRELKRTSHHYLRRLLLGWRYAPWLLFAIILSGMGAMVWTDVMGYQTSRLIMGSVMSGNPPSGVMSVLLSFDLSVTIHIFAFLGSFGRYLLYMLVPYALVQAIEWSLMRRRLVDELWLTRIPPEIYMRWLMRMGFFLGIVAFPIWRLIAFIPGMMRYGFERALELSYTMPHQSTALTFARGGPVPVSDLMLIILDGATWVMAWSTISVLVMIGAVLLVDFQSLWQFFKRALILPAVIVFWEFARDLLFRLVYQDWQRFASERNAGVQVFYLGSNGEALLRLGFYILAVAINVALIVLFFRWWSKRLPKDYIRKMVSPTIFQSTR